VQLRYGWRASFYLFGILGVAWSIVWYAWFRDSPREMPYLVKGRGFSAAALVFSTVPYIVGACANISGGIASDVLVRKLGLKAGRRIVGVLGLGAAATFMTASNELRDQCYRQCVFGRVRISGRILRRLQAAVWGRSSKLGSKLQRVPEQQRRAYDRSA